MTTTEIRAGVIERLTGATTAGDRVSDSPLTPIQAGDTLPAICVWTPSATEENVGAGRQLPHVRITETIDIQAAVRAADEASLAAAMDVIERQVRRALLTDHTWFTQFEKVERVECTRELGDAEAEDLIGSVHLGITVTYRHRYQPDTSPGDPLEELRLEIQARTGSDDATVLEAAIEIEQE